MASSGCKGPKRGPCRAFCESRTYHLVPSSQATSRTKPPSAISQRHRRRSSAAVKIAEGDLRRADSLRPSRSKEDGAPARREPCGEVNTRV